MSAYQCLLHTCILVRSQHFVSHAMSIMGSVEYYIKDDRLFVILFISSNVCPGTKLALASHQSDVGVVFQCFT